MKQQRLSIQAVVVMMVLISTIVKASDDSDNKPSAQTQTRYVIAAKALRSGDYDKACQLLEKMVAEEPEVAKYRYALSMAYARQGDYVKNWEQLRQTLRLNPTHPEATRDITLLWQVFNDNGLFNVGVSVDQIQAQLGTPDHVKTNQSWQGWRYAFWLIEVVDGKVERVLDVRKVDPKLMLFTDNVEFFVDSNSWVPGHRSGNRYHLKTDYVLPPQTPQYWDQLFSSQHFLGASHIPLSALLEMLRQQLFAIDSDIDWRIISETENAAIYEWRSHKMPGPAAQHTLGHLIVGERDVHQLSYTAKVSRLPPQTRQHWLNLLQKAQLVRTGEQLSTQPDILVSFNSH